MQTSTPNTHWLQLTHLGSRFSANVSALATRYPDLATTLQSLVPTHTYFICTENDLVVLGVNDGDGVRALPAILTPASAKATMDSMFPENSYKLALVAGEDLGWLWNMMYQMQVSVPSAPGHRPPLFFMIRDLQRLWVILHIQDWKSLLADARVRLFAGEDCVQQFRQSLIEQPMCPWPKLAVTLTPDIWPAGVTFDSIFVESCATQSAQLARLNRQLEMLAARNSPRAMTDKFKSGEPLKVLGITSRYTSFIQHSMRDWLDAFNRLGHTTRLAIEPADHLTSNNIALAQTCIDFDPDLIVCIDHYRASIAGVPTHIPMVMWVQDAMPALFTPDAGKAQGPLDFAMGIAPLKMVHEFGYPEDRYMPALIGANDARFGPGPLGKANRFACDVSFVSHASTPPQVFLDRTLQQHNSARANSVITDIFNRLKDIYDTGGVVTEPVVIRRLIDTAMIETKTTVPVDQIPVLMHIFGAQINNAFFRHQPLQWLSDAGFNLHLYGNGWEQHPTLGKHAKGPADNQRQLAEIYRTSKINLHASPYGAVHQRVFETLSCGGFSMLRYCPGDVLERPFATIWKFCLARSIGTDAQLKQQATPEILDLLQTIEQTLQRSPFEEPWSFMDALRFGEKHGCIRGAGTILENDFDAVSFASEKELVEKAAHFLRDETDRNRTAASMRQAVMDRFTYLATTRQLLRFIDENLQRKSIDLAQAA